MVCRVGTRATLACIAAASIAFFIPAIAHAQIGSERYSSIVTEAASGTVLSADSPDELRHPASLTKMMTLYMVFEALRDRRIGLEQAVPVSLHAASMQPSKLGLRPGMDLGVEEAILGLVTKSANDAASALGEMLGGSEERFGEMMTLRARALGMSRTVFRNASGLPDPEQVTTARDLSTLARRLIADFPNEYRYFSTPSFVFHGRVIPNHDAMLQTYPGADGIKTGYIDTSGHNLVTSAIHGNVRLIGVVLGAASNGQRDTEMSSLLDAGFDQMDAPPVSRGEMQAWRSAPALFNQAHAASFPPSVLPFPAPVQPAQAYAPRPEPAPRIEQAYRADPVLPPVFAPSVQRASARSLMPETPHHQARPAPSLFYGLQVGTYANEAVARQALAAAHRAAGAGEPRVEQAFVHGKAMWRAQIMGLTEVEMRGAAGNLARHRIPVQVISPEPQRLASR